MIIKLLSFKLIKNSVNKEVNIAHHIAGLDKFNFNLQCQKNVTNR